MPDQLVKTDTMICSVSKAASSVVARATLSDPKSGGWSMFLDGTFKQGGNGPTDLDLGPAAELIGKILEVSATMKNVTGGLMPMSLQVDAAAQSNAMQGDVAPGNSAHYSIFVVFVEAS